MAKDLKEIKEKNSKDEKKKKQFSTWSWYLAWGAFAAVLLGAAVKLFRSFETPKKEDHYF